MITSQEDFYKNRKDQVFKILDDIVNTVCTIKGIDRDNLFKRRYPPYIAIKYSIIHVFYSLLDGKTSMDEMAEYFGYNNGSSIFQALRAANGYIETRYRHYSCYDEIRDIVLEKINIFA